MMTLMVTGSCSPCLAEGLVELTEFLAWLRLRVDRVAG